jgi:hypothetical protein
LICMELRQACKRFDNITTLSVDRFQVSICIHIPSAQAKSNCHANSAIPAMKERITHLLFTRYTLGK